ncbi:NADPH-dependent FMN reductase [Bacillus sp. FJAT-27225]|uniref:NADPH-dependent FMN reductase n=1 Tax=Bacillus sp. FJAT-27225 TaxID=1743144 RepID=UPI00080C2A8F|nr:NADPH-dependent FMN reductase [Bacillus sp. FJAT-27225]OCA90542.1 NADPH-dependent FMN reductase [Bacillus sp. FJAT-27225]
MKVAALVGSVRKDSLNLQLVETLRERYSEKFELSVVEICGLPFFNQDEELDPSEEVKRFKQEIHNADAVLIATPEYNWSVPGVLKNALDWLSRVDFVLKNKPVLIVGATPGVLGTIRAQQHLRQILSSPGLQARVLQPAGNEILVTQALNKFQNGRLIDEATLAFIDDVVERFIDFAKA